MGQRNFTRIPVRIEAFVNSRGHSFKAAVENLSLNGMCLRTSETSVAGDKVTITLCLTGVAETSRLPVTLAGMVIWCENGYLSVQFLPMDIATFTQVRNVIAYNAGDAGRIMHEFVASLHLEESEMQEAV